MLSNDPFLWVVLIDKTLLTIQIRAMKYNKMVKIIIIQLLLITLSKPVFSQKNKEFSLNKITTSDKNVNQDIKYTKISFKSFDSETNEKLPLIVRVDNISLIILDSSAQTISLAKGNHFVQVGWIGYNYSDKIKLRVKLTEEYEINFYLKRELTRTID